MGNGLRVFKLGIARGQSFYADITHDNFFFLFSRLVGWAAQLAPASYPDFLSYFFPTGFFSAGFFWTPSNPRCLVSGCPALVIFLAAIGGI